MKGASYLGLDWYDDVISRLHGSKHFARLAQASGDFANTIDDLDVLKEVGKLNEKSNGAYRILKGDAGKVMDNFAETWDTRVQYRSGDDVWEVVKSGGSVRMTQYRSGSVIDGKRRPTIFLNESGGTQKIRFGDSKYSYE